MNASRAEQNLAVIRTLMERSAVYRRALAPIFLVVGIIGVIGAVVGILRRIDDSTIFALYWLGVALVALCVAFAMARRQASRDNEPFWSPPTRRVALALFPPLALGAVATLLYWDQAWIDSVLGFVVIWLGVYGCALHAAGFFTPRAIRYVGWAFLVMNAVALAILMRDLGTSPRLAHGLMGVTFGGLHLLCGVYLRFTQKGSNVS